MRFRKAVYKRPIAKINRQVNRLMARDFGEYASFKIDSVREECITDGDVEVFVKCAVGTPNGDFKQKDVMLPQTIRVFDYKSASAFLFGYFLEDLDKMVK